MRGLPWVRRLFPDPWESPAHPGHTLILGASKAAWTHHLPICLFLHHSLLLLLIHSFTLSSEYLSSYSGHALCKASTGHGGAKRPGCWGRHRPAHGLAHGEHSADTNVNEQGISRQVGIHPFPRSKGMNRLWRRRVATSHLLSPRLPSLPMFPSHSSVFGRPLCGGGLEELVTTLTVRTLLPVECLRVLPVFP